MTPITSVSSILSPLAIKLTFLVIGILLLIVLYKKCSVRKIPEGMSTTYQVIAPTKDVPYVVMKKCKR